MRNISLIALALGLDGLGRELRLRGDERHLCRDRNLRVGIEHDAAVGTEPYLARCHNPIITPRAMPVLTGSRAEGWNSSTFMGLLERLWQH